MGERKERHKMRAEAVARRKIPHQEQENSSGLVLGGFCQNEPESSAHGLESSVGMFLPGRSQVLLNYTVLHF